MKTRIFLFAAILMTGFFAACSQSEEENTDISIDKIESFNTTKDMVAIGGYDPVAYLDGQVLVGSDDFVVEVSGTKFKFATEDNMKKFESAPEKYTPAYGGWCAFAMGEHNKKVPVDPGTYKVIDGKVYLFYNKGQNNTLDLWNKNESTLKEKADKNWSNIEGN